jgi:hypothetical protein
MFQHHKAAARTRLVPLSLLFRCEFWRSVDSTSQRFKEDYDPKYFKEEKEVTMLKGD